MNVEKTVRSAAEIARDLRTHFWIDGEPPPSNGPVPHIVGRLFVNLNGLREELPDETPAMEPGATVMEREQVEALDALRRLHAVVGELCQVFRVVRGGGYDEHLMVEYPTAVDGAVVRALEWAASVLGEAERKSAPGDSRPGESGARRE